MRGEVGCAAGSGGAVGSEGLGVSGVTFLRAWRPEDSHG